MPRTLLAAAVALPFVGWAVLRGFGLERGPLVMLVAFTPYVAAAAALPVLVAALARRWWIAAAAAVAGLVLAGLVVPRTIVHQGPPRPGSPLLVVSANMLKGTASVDDLAALVRERGADVIAVQEYTAATEAAMSTRFAEFPHRVTNPEPSTTGSALYSRFPLRETGVRRNAGGFSQARAVLAAPGSPPVAVESVHPRAPSALDAIDRWTVDLRAQPRATPDGPLRLLIGDFNATLDHRLLRDLLDTGYRDVGAVAGDGLAGTWGPYDGDRIPPVTIDHVLADRRIGVRGYATRPLAGGDHRALWAHLTLPPA
ncbi:endonuclease/exonuclease/phosphatase family protein [Pilimelia anulata]|nr:endonuclease/exonuclease/phosphatase family protein [Pilimelia anulata]